MSLNDCFFPFHFAYDIMHQLPQHISRYDGLYSVDKMFDSEGFATKMFPTGNDQYTFFLVRLTNRRNDQDNKYTNEISTAELRSKINTNRLEEGTFVLNDAIPQYEQLSRLHVMTSNVHSYTTPRDRQTLYRTSIAHEQRLTKQHAQQSNLFDIFPYSPARAQCWCNLQIPNSWLSESLAFSRRQREGGFRIKDFADLQYGQYKFQTSLHTSSSHSNAPCIPYVRQSERSNNQHNFSRLSHNLISQTMPPQIQQISWG